MSEHQCCGGGCHTEENSPCSSCACHSLPESQKNPIEVKISTEEEAFLQKLSQCPFLPVAEYITTSSKSHHLRNVALSPVFLETGKETVPDLNTLGDIILDLEERDIISLDFDTPLDGTDESLFTNSHSFQLLQDTVKEGMNREDFLFDQTHIEYGSVCLTALGEIIIEQLRYL